MKQSQIDYSYLPDFKYGHNNPYHDRLKEFDGFVLRDDEGEQNSGLWNQNVFKREAPLHVEIGSGYGHFMTEFCANNPQINFVGMDYRFKRSYQLAKKLSSLENQHFRYLRAKGERLSYNFAENEIDCLYYFFPDPWPKTRHQKKRLFQAPFINQAFKVLKPGGRIFIKTDHVEYALWMAEHIHQHKDQFEKTMHSTHLYEEAPGHFLASFQTKFEKIFLNKGIKIKAFELRSKKTQSCH